VTDPSIKWLAESGLVFEADWVSPIVKVPGLDAKTRPDNEAFCGTATLIGRSFFLTARHLIPGSGKFFDSEGIAIAENDAYFLAVTDTREQVSDVVQVVEFEGHPDPNVDLGIGQIQGWRCTPPFAAIGFPVHGDDLVCLGYPEDLEAFQLNEHSFEMRYLKGYMTRSLDPPGFGVTAPSMELNFAIPRGMSGSPVYSKAPTRSLMGLAIGSQASHVAEHESLLHPDIPDGSAVYRVVEYGVALRFSALLDWRIAMADGVTFGELMTRDKGLLMPPE